MTGPENRKVGDSTPPLTTSLRCARPRAAQRDEQVPDPARRRGVALHEQLRPLGQGLGEPAAFGPAADPVA